MTDRPEYTLLGTTDAMIWAEEFCRIFEGATVGSPHGNDNNSHVWVDEDTMIAWFANAMQTAINMYERNALSAKQELEESFVDGFQEGREDVGD